MFFYHLVLFISLQDITSINRFESSGGVYSFIIYSRERSLFLRAETLKNMEMWFRAIQMHADLARGGNGFTILSNQATPPKNRFNKQTSLVAQLEKATQALTALEKTASVDLRNDCRDIGISIEPDAESSRYHHEDEVKEDPFYSNSNDFLYQPPSSVTSRISSSTTTTTASRPPTSTQRPQYRHEDSLEDSTESLESIVPTVRKSASHYKSTQNGNFHGVKERYDEDRELSGKSGESSTGCRAWE